MPVHGSLFAVLQEKFISVARQQISLSIRFIETGESILKTDLLN